MRGHCLFSTDTCYKGPSDERTLFSTDTCYIGPSGERTLSVQCRKQIKMTFCIVLLQYSLI